MREEIIESLKTNRLSAKELSSRFSKSTAAIENDLEHIRTTLRNDPNYQLLMKPANCMLCGHLFSNDKVKTPTRCPKCNKEKIDPTSFKIDKR